MPRALFQQTEDSVLGLEDGRRIELTGLLGSGALSTVYRATMQSTFGLRRAVAAKVFGRLSTDDADQVTRAIALAAQRTAWIRHPNVVATLDCVGWQGRIVLVNELLEGDTLDAVLTRHTERQQRLPVDVALFIATEVAEALSAARVAVDEHGMRLGILHQGLTMREIFLSRRGEVKVDGFELNSVRGGTSSVRSLDGAIRRMHMMPPEIACGEAGDPRADVFSLGILVRELLVGPRFAPGTSNADAIRFAREGFVEPMNFQPHLPADLLEVMLRALAVDPAARFPNATAMAFELRRIAFGMGVGDGRYFLRRLLDREAGEGGQEITGEFAAPSRERAFR